MNVFQGLKDYRAEDPRLLRQDLQRQNMAVVAALSAVLDAADLRLVPRSVDSGETQAAVGELVVAGTNVTVRLPPSSPAAAGRRVGVAMAGGGSVFVAASGTDTVAGIATYTMSTPGQFLEFADGGDGRWWRS